MDNAIRDFLTDRKMDRVKKKTSAFMTAEEVLAVEQEANQVFMLDNWLPDAARRANQLSLTSHPGKFSHPDAKVSPVIAESKRSEDGFLRTGNASTTLDVFGNAAAMDVFKFLSLTLSDGKTILEHLERDSDKIKDELQIASVSFEALSAGLLSIKKMHENSVTSGKVKQIYFPVGDDYHLLSILTPSGLVFELRNRIQNIRFSDQVKKAREDKRKNIHNDIGFDDLYDLSMIGYGGTKPQNISVLNSAYGGKAYLLPCIPPKLVQQNQRLPKNNFFINTLWGKHFKNELLEFHKLLNTEYNNKREGLSRKILLVMDGVIEKMWSVRAQSPGWSSRESYSQLPRHQKIWLDETYKETRHQEDAWLQIIITEIARWIITAYKKVLGHEAISLADRELVYIKTIIEKNKEDLL